MTDSSGFTVDVGFVRQSAADVQAALEPMAGFLQQFHGLSDALRAGVGVDPGPDAGYAPEVGPGHWAPAPAAPITGVSVTQQMQGVLDFMANAMTGLVVMGEQIQGTLTATADDYEHREQSLHQALAAQGGQWHAPMLPPDDLAREQGTHVDLTAPPPPPQVDLTAPNPPAQVDLTAPTPPAQVDLTAPNPPGN